MKYTYLILFTVVSFIVAYFINYMPLHKRKYYIQELDLRVGNDCYHLHHWIIFSILLIVLFVGRYIKNDIIFHSIIGLCLGFILEDFLFTGVHSSFRVKYHCLLTQW